MPSDIHLPPSGENKFYNKESKKISLIIIELFVLYPSPLFIMGPFCFNENNFLKELGQRIGVVTDDFRKTT